MNSGSGNNSKANGLMGDLESIKALLEEDDMEAVPEAGVLPLSEALNPPIDEVEAEGETEEEGIAVEVLNTFDPKTGLSTPHSEETKGQNEILTHPEPDTLAAEETRGQISNLTPASTDDLPNPQTPTSLDALLSADFHTATAEAMNHARELINDHPTEWSPQQTDELADALRVRIDDAVHQWIQTSLAAHAGELQHRLLNAVRDELAHHLDAFENTPDV